MVDGDGVKFLSEGMALLRGISSLSVDEDDDDSEDEDEEGESEFEDRVTISATVDWERELPSDASCYSEAGCSEAPTSEVVFSTRFSTSEAASS